MGLPVLGIVGWLELALAVTNPVVAASYVALAAGAAGEC